MPKITLDITGLNEILGQDYVIEKMGTLILYRSTIHFYIIFSYLKLTYLKKVLAMPIR